MRSVPQKKHVFPAIPQPQHFSESPACGTSATHKAFFGTSKFSKASGCGPVANTIKGAVADPDLKDAMRFRWVGWWFEKTTHVFSWECIMIGDLIRTIHTPKLFKQMFTDIILHRFWAIYGNLVYFIIFLTSSTSCLSSFCVAAVWYGLVAIICPESCPPIQMRSCHNAEIYPEMNLATRYITNRALKINMESKTYIYIVYITNLQSKIIWTTPPFLCSIFLFNWALFRFHSSIFQECSGL